MRIKTVFYLAQEEIPSRYTGMVNAIWKQVPFTVFIPASNSEAVVECSSFISPLEASNNKLCQLFTAISLIKEGHLQSGDCLLLSDIWFPGMEVLRYLADSLRLKITIGAVNHAGRADPTDFVQSFESWADSAEQSFHDCCDFVFTGSEFHRQNILRKFKISPDKVIATGQPFSIDWMNAQLNPEGPVHPLAANAFAWPHRLAAEKGLNELIALATHMPSVDFVVLSGSSVPASNEVRCKGLSNIKVLDSLTKSQYYSFLRHCKGFISTSYQETFGYSLHEAIALECPIIAPNRACYGEVLQNKNCLYSNERELIEKVSAVCSGQDCFKEPIREDYFKMLLEVPVTQWSYLFSKEPI